MKIRRSSAINVNTKNLQPSINYFVSSTLTNFATVGINTAVNQGYISKVQGDFIFTAVQISTICAFPHFAIPVFFAGASFHANQYGKKDLSSWLIRNFFLSITQQEINKQSITSSLLKNQ